MQSYHLRRHDKALEDETALHDILRATRYVTVAMCSGDRPYLVTLNHGFDEIRNCLYVHCAPQGRKMDVLRENPLVWGIAVDDLGYLDGRCDHAYRTVMFGGRIEFIDDLEEKRNALHVMIHQQESDPEAVIEEQLTERAVAAVTIGRIVIEEMSGKEARG